MKGVGKAILGNFIFIGLLNRPYKALKDLIRPYMALKDLIRPSGAL